MLPWHHVCIKYQQGEHAAHQYHFPLLVPHRLGRVGGGFFLVLENLVLRAGSDRIAHRASRLEVGGPLSRLRSRLEAKKSPSMFRLKPPTSNLQHHFTALCPFEKANEEYYLSGHGIVPQEQ
jgi:hypothetical protein